MGIQQDLFCGDQVEKREAIYADLLEHVGSHIVQDAIRCTTRLKKMLPQPLLSDNTVFVAYGGGKDSSYIVCFVRLMQLILWQEERETFRLRIATNRHSGMPHSVLENIDRAYSALGLYHDPDVELFLIDGDEVRPFDLDLPLPLSIKVRNRLDILMTGHRCEGEARPTFCNACNLSMVHSFRVMLGYKAGIDVMITGDSKQELHAYTLWIRQIALKLKLAHPPEDGSFRSFLNTVEDIEQKYYTHLYVDEQHKEPLPRRAPLKFVREPFFFSVYRDTAYKVDDHWKILTDFLAFQFTEDAFNFTESDCGNPALMAHLRGLKIAHVYGRTYEEGIAEYLHFVIRLMEQKDFPPALIQQAQARYSSPAAIEVMKKKMDQYALDVFDLSEEQLVCMIYSPFVQRGKNLARYLEHEQPELYPLLEDIHLLLRDTTCPTVRQSSLVVRLQQLSHLELEQLRVLYGKNVSVKHTLHSEDPIAIILADDPHKAEIQTTHFPGGPSVTDVITGR
ncbi:PqqD family protein [Tengunoibacter tsumagoiensis]|uniref:Uncharacterized protein n=1 Tax=Tengunoibacter tsumagoiensis TaxID=2014871 RepID=A0A402A9K8_9CHLR|nr:PqqD family protein [Tengunoibacter tsumagoiensis]GCE15833.1 hypothetical protein KTT_56920 [Tengunoibacter tsumagoiensis]